MNNRVDLLFSVRKNQSSLPIAGRIQGREPKTNEKDIGCSGEGHQSSDGHSDGRLYHPDSGAGDQPLYLQQYGNMVGAGGTLSVHLDDLPRNARAVSARGARGLYDGCGALSEEAAAYDPDCYPPVGADVLRVLAHSGD